MWKVKLRMRKKALMACEGGGGVGDDGGGVVNGSGSVVVSGSDGGVEKRWCCLGKAGRQIRSPSWPSRPRHRAASCRSGCL